MFNDSHGEDVDGLTDCITDYIQFCVDDVLPTKNVRCFSNNKPSVTGDLKGLLNPLGLAQAELKKRIGGEQDTYGRKVEESLAQNNVCEVWK